MSAQVIELHPEEFSEVRCGGCCTWTPKFALTLREDVLPQGLYCDACSLEIDSDVAEGPECDCRSWCSRCAGEL